MRSLALILVVGLALLLLLAVAQETLMPPLPPTPTGIPDCEIHFDLEPQESDWDCWWNTRQRGHLICPPLEAQPLWKKLTDTFGCRVP